MYNIFKLYININFKQREREREW